MWRTKFLTVASIGLLGIAAVGVSVTTSLGPGDNYPARRHCQVGEVAGRSFLVGVELTFPMTACVWLACGAFTMRLSV